MPPSTLELQVEATQKAAQLKIENPTKSVYVIYDYESGKFDAITTDDLDYYQETDHNFTIIYCV